MKPGRFAHAIAVLLSSISSLFADSTPSKAEPAKVKFSKKSNKLSEDLSLKADPISFSPGHVSAIRPDPGQRYPWKKSIVTTIFWIGEQPSGNNPVPNRTSSWDKQWTKNYGGFEHPKTAHPKKYNTIKVPQQTNPLHCSHPSNTQTTTKHRPDR